MEAKIINCYLCNEQAQREEYFDKTRIVRINCPKCKKYLLTQEALYFYFERKDGKIILDKIDKKKLSDYVIERYNPEKNEAIPINIRIIEAVTGKRSIHSEYE